MKKKHFRNTSVQTRCRPFQNQLTLAVGTQHHSPQGPMPGGHGQPHCPPLHPQCEESHAPWGFFWVVEVELSVVAQCVCTAWRGGMFTKGWLQSCLIEEVSVPLSTPIPENWVLVSGRNLGWIHLLWVTMACLSPLHFDEVTLANDRLLLVPSLGGYCAMRACGLISEMIQPLEVSEVASCVKTVSPGHFTFQSSSPSHIFPLGIHSYGCQWTETEKLWKYTQEGEVKEGRGLLHRAPVITSSGFSFLIFFTWQFCSKRGILLLPLIYLCWECRVSGGGSKGYV